eukprot:s421_g34.t1
MKSSFGQRCSIRSTHSTCSRYGIDLVFLAMLFRDIAFLEVGYEVFGPAECVYAICHCWTLLTDSLRISEHFQRINFHSGKTVVDGYQTSENMTSIQELSVLTKVFILAITFGLCYIACTQQWVHMEWDCKTIYSLSVTLGTSNASWPKGYNMLGHIAVAGVFCECRDRQLIIGSTHKVAEERYDPDHLPSADIIKVVFNENLGPHQQGGQAFSGGHILLQEYSALMIRISGNTVREFDFPTTSWVVHKVQSPQIPGVYAYDSVQTSV